MGVFRQWPARITPGLGRPGQTSELLARMMQARLVSPLPLEGASTGSLHGPPGCRAYDMRVECGAQWAFLHGHCCALGPERHDEPLLPQARGSEHWLPGTSPALVVKNMAHSPVGARLTVGSWAKTGWATSRRVNAQFPSPAPASDLEASAAAWTALLLLRHDLMPTELVISAANMW